MTYNERMRLYNQVISLAILGIIVLIVLCWNDSREAVIYAIRSTLNLASLIVSSF